MRIGGLSDQESSSSSFYCFLGIVAWERGLKASVVVVRWG